MAKKPPITFSDIFALKFAHIKVSNWEEKKKAIAEAARQEELEAEMKEMQEQMARENEAKKAQDGGIEIRDDEKAKIINTLGELPMPLYGNLRDAKKLTPDPDLELLIRSSRGEVDNMGINAQKHRRPTLAGIEGLYDRLRYLQQHISIRTEISRRWSLDINASRIDKSISKA